MGGNDIKGVSPKRRKMSLGISVGFCMMSLKDICYKDNNKFSRFRGCENVPEAEEKWYQVLKVRFLNLSLGF